MIKREVSEITGEEKRELFGIGKFRFENEQVNRWVELGGNIEYRYETRKTGITLLNQTEGLLSFTFHLEVNPEGEVKFSGDCMLFSPILKYLIQILKAKKDTEIRTKNQEFITALNKVLLKRCLDRSKEICEKEEFNLVGLETLICELGLENI